MGAARVHSSRLGPKWLAGERRLPISKGYFFHALVARTRAWKNCPIPKRSALRGEVGGVDHAGGLVADGDRVAGFGFAAEDRQGDRPESRREHSRANHAQFSILDANHHSALGQRLSSNQPAQVAVRLPLVMHPSNCLLPDVATLLKVDGAQVQTSLTRNVLFANFTPKRRNPSLNPQQIKQLLRPNRNRIPKLRLNPLNRTRRNQQLNKTTRTNKDISLFGAKFDSQIGPFNGR